jgi:hypothetical protein
MEWCDIASIRGSADRGDIGFEVRYTLPGATCDLPASDRQAEAVRLFYGQDFGELRESQAHALLSCREYARLCCDTIFNKYPDGMRRGLAPCIAAFLLSDPKTVEFVVNWNDRNFSRGTGSPRVRGTPCFADVEDFSSYLEGTLEMNGWTLKVIRADSFRRV